METTDRTAGDVQARSSENRPRPADADWKKRLNQAVHECLSRNDLHIVEDISNCSWSEVLDLWEKARAGHAEAGLLWKNPFRYVGRKMGKYGPIVSPVLNMIPDEYGVCVLHGGLALIFSLTQHKSANNQMIRETFDKVPRILDTLSKNLKLHKNDAELQVRASDLINTLADTMVELIQLFIAKGLKNWFKAPFMGQTIGNKLAKLQGTLVRFEDSAKILLDRTVVEIRQITGNVENQMSLVRKATVDAGIEIRHVEDGLVGVRRSVDHISEDLGRDLHAHTIILSDISSKNQDVFQICQHLLDEFTQLKQDCVRWQRSASSETNSPTKSWTQQPQRCGGAPNITANEFVDCMDIPLRAATDDLRAVLKATDMETLSIGQANSLLHTSAFTSWLSQPVPRLLVVESLLGKIDKVSPMSLFCARLSQSILENNLAGGGGVLLFFFCGKHDMDTYPVSGPVGLLLRSLITQLFINLYATKLLDLEALSAAVDLYKLAEWDLVTLWQTFRELVGQLTPGTPVYCIIDGISYFETPKWGEDVRGFIWELAALVSDLGLGAIFKALVTTPGRLRGDYQFLPPEQLVRLSRNNADRLPNLQRAMREINRVSATAQAPPQWQNWQADWGTRE